jgi:tellurite resistance-related uncharacterized protein
MQPSANPSHVPEGLCAYKRTAEFTQATIPAGLTKDHCTKAGVWGIIHVTAGRLRYRIADPRRLASDAVLAAGGVPGVVEPTIVHRVDLLDGARFFVEFWRADAK